MNKSLYIGNIELVFNLDDVFSFSKELQEYLLPVHTVAKTITYQIQFETHPKPINIRPVAQIDYPPQLIGITESGECRIYQNLFDGQLIAVYEETSINSANLIFYDRGSQNFEITLNTLNYLAIERHLISAEALVLHSSFIGVENEAILFTAPSGTGKSTQAELWEKYRNAKIMNGDRSLLLPTQNGWKVAGFPFSGSSNIYHNGIFPIRAIVRIHQSPQNEGGYASRIQAFKTIYPEIVRNYWNADYDDTVCHQLENLLYEIPAIVYGCNMKEEAVNCLEEIINSSRRN